MHLLRKVDICGRDYRVLEVTPEEHPEIEGCEGLCDYTNATIYIAQGRAETVRIDTLLHEIVHGVIEATGHRLKLQTASEAAGHETDHLEEELVVALTPALRAALKSAGWREPKRVGKTLRKSRAKAVTT